MSQAEHEFALRLDSRVDDNSERIAKLESKLNTKVEKTIRQSISETGGLIALCLSITLASYTAYNNFVVQPKKDLVQKEINLRNDLNALSDMALKIATLNWRDDPVSANYQATMYTSQRVALRNKIISASLDMPHVIGFPDRFMILNEFETTGFLQEALQQADLAMSLATTPVEMANVHWAKGRLSGNSNFYGEMKNNFQLALEEFNQAGFYNNAYNIFQIYGSWIYFELVNNSCGDAQMIFSQMQADYAKPQVLQQTRDLIKPQFEQVVSQAPSSCSLSLSL